MYESFYGLTRSPFRLSPDSHFLYLAKSHRKAIDFLQYGIKRGEGFIVITGEIGAGKTIVLRELMRVLSARKYLVGELASTRVGPDDIPPLVASAFGFKVAESSKGVLLPKLHGFLGDLAKAKRRAILMVDEAQNLSVEALEELRMLSNAQVGDRPLVQSFLIGQPELRDTLQQPELIQLKQRVIASCHLEPLSEVETREYVRHRLSRAGWKDDPLIADASLDVIHALSGGIPRQINALCERMLLDAYLSERHEISPEHVSAVAAELQAELGGMQEIRMSSTTP